MKDVTILIPAYNEEKHIEQAILSAVTQAEFVIVSDNCSTDKTPEICKKLAKEYKNLIFYEQKENIGSVMNFQFLLDKVKTKYTLHIGAHDYISKNYTLKLKEVLEQKAVLDKIDSTIVAETIVVGSLVVANGIYLYLSLALPKITIEGINIIALSPQSPLGSKLMGNKVGFEFEINTTKYTIQEIY